MLDLISALKTQELTESTSIALLEKIEGKPVLIPGSSAPLLTTYVRQGNGKLPIVLLHGFDSSVLEFRRLLPQLATQQETWAIDLLGFGFTERSPQVVITPETIKAHLYASWQTLMNQPMILVGVSMGGAVAIDFTLTYPEVVKKLILIDSAGFAQGTKQGNLLLTPLIYLAAEFLRNSRVRRFVSRKAYFNKEFASRDAEVCAALHLQMANWRRAMVAFTQSGGYNFLRDKIAQISHPTLILWGESDEILGTGDAAKFEEAIAHSKLLWIKDCGHVPHLEQPQVTAQAILEFITDCP